MTPCFPRLRHSLTALLAGWAACYLAWWFGAIPAFVWFNTDVRQWSNVLALAFILGLNSGVVLLGVWLLLILPLEVLFKADWACKQHAARCGFLASLPFALLWVAWSVALAVRQPHDSAVPESAEKLEVILGTIPYVLATLAAGTVFGWARARFAGLPRDHTGIALKAVPLLWLAGSLPAPSATNEPAAPTKPNILFIIADDLATRLGCYGDKAALTPNLDRLASEGVVFNRAYCQGSVCTPSRTSFMLGLNTRHAKANHFILHPETVTLGRWFREHGYQTAAIGKIDHDDPNDAYTDPQAWDVRVKRENMAPKLPAQNTFFDEDLGQRRKRVSLIRVADSPEAMADWVRAERMIQFFDKERDPAKPFFAAIGFHTPHVPWDATRAHFEAHDPDKFKPENTPSGATPLPPGSLLQEPGLEISDAHQREGLRAYYAAVTTLDHEIGRLLDALRARGLLDNTLVVFTSDHGYHLGWRGQWCKHSLAEQVLRVPLIVRHPEGAKGAKAGGIVELLDLFPTFCDFARLPVPDSLDGKSFLPLLLDPKSEGKPGAFCQWGNGRTVRTERWRLTERRDGSAELYDHSTDPAEYHNLIAKPGLAQLAKRLHGMLEAEFGPAQRLRNGGSMAK